MRILKLAAGSSAVMLIGLGVLLAGACSVNVKKGANQEDKKVDISTPIGGIHVSQSADVKDTGLALYPGARPAPKENDHDEKNANVNISSPLFGLRVVAQEYVSDETPEKLIGFYSNELKRYGKVLECHTSWHGGDVTVHKDSGNKSKELSCDNVRDGKATELKVGTEENQHIVAIQPEGKGSKFALVYVKVHTNDDTI